MNNIFIQTIMLSIRYLNQNAPSIEIPSSKWTRNWGMDVQNSGIIYELIRSQKPEVIVETGTFEGQATYVMAKAAHDNNNNCRIYTIDYDGDPTSDFDPKEWLKLKELRNANLEKIKNEFPNCKVIYVEGDSRLVLDTIFTQFGETQWNLFYQDSMHFFDGIMSEWNIMEKYQAPQSITIFDDMWLKGVKKFANWFKKNKSEEYQTRIINVGHKQFIVQKLS